MPPFGRNEASPCPIRQFQIWYEQAQDAMPLACAMTLATCGQGGPGLRTALLKAVDERGFVFYTNYASNKARDMERDKNVSLLFHWPVPERQVIVRGTAARTDARESDAYFASRARASQLGAWASRQSSPLESRDALLAQVADMESRFAGRAVPRPPFWGGYRVWPLALEFWQGRGDRLHDRLFYSRAGDGWHIERLSP